MRVQLKSRLAFYKKYKGKNLFIAFGEGDEWYLYPHDELLSKILRTHKFGSAQNWIKSGAQNFPRLSKYLQELLEPWRISGSAKARPE